MFWVRTELTKQILLKNRFSFAGCLLLRIVAITVVCFNQINEQQCSKLHQIEDEKKSRLANKEKLWEGKIDTAWRISSCTTLSAFQRVLTFPVIFLLRLPCFCETTLLVGLSLLFLHPVHRFLLSAAGVCCVCLSMCVLWAMWSFPPTPRELG